MATISPRYGDQQVRIGWQVRIRKKGHPAQVKTFRNKAEVERWVRSVESEIDRGVFMSRSEAENTTLAELLDRYAAEVTALKREASQERSHIIGFALETAMRWDHVNLGRKVVTVPEPKTGEARQVPLSSAAIQVLQSLPRHISGLA